MERTIFTPDQLEILDFMSYVENEETLNEIRDMLSRYFAQKAEKEIEDKHFNVLSTIDFPRIDVINLDTFLALLLNEHNNR